MTLDSGVRAPRARSRGLIVQELPDELMIYDADDKKVSCLNRTVASVWRHCDGERTVTQLSRCVSAELGTQFDEAATWYALRQLDRRELLDARINVPSAVKKMTRREAVRALGLAAVAIPLITSMVVPPSTQAQSGGGGSPCETGQTACTSNADCNAANNEECISGCCVAL
jgi:hypothetical protein